MVWGTYTLFLLPLAVAKEREVEGDLFLWDMGEGLGFRPGAFDGAISVSALQWLCNADRADHHPPKRLYHFFSSLYAALVWHLIHSVVYVVSLYVLGITLCLWCP